MRATINGSPRELPDNLTVASLLDFLGSPRLGVAIARNDRVVPRSEYERESVRDGDRLEIIEAVAGG